MMKTRKALGAVLVLTMMMGALSACQKHEGPAEQAGKSVDKALDQAGKKIEQAGDSIQDAAKGEKK